MLETWQRFRKYKWLCRLCYCYCVTEWFDTVITLGATCRVYSGASDSSYDWQCRSCRLLRVVLCPCETAVDRCWTAGLQWCDDPSLTNVVVDPVRWCRGFAGRRSLASDWIQSVVLQQTHIIIHQTSLCC